MKSVSPCCHWLPNSHQRPHQLHRKSLLHRSRQRAERKGTTATSLMVEKGKASQRVTRGSQRRLEMQVAQPPHQMAVRFVLTFPSRDVVKVLQKVPVVERDITCVAFAMDRTAFWTIRRVDSHLRVMLIGNERIHHVQISNPCLRQK